MKLIALVGVALYLQARLPELTQIQKDQVAGKLSSILGSVCVEAGIPQTELGKTPLPTYYVSREVCTAYADLRIWCKENIS